VEELRDTLLALDGSLDERAGGTLQSGFGTDGENSNDRLSLRPEDSQRRTVYLPLRRANLASMLNLFDFGDAVTTQGKRQTTTVAPQALFMRNSKFLHERSAGLADALLDQRINETERAELAYLSILSRQPSPEESRSLLAYVGNLRRGLDSPLSQRDAWASACRVLLASNEFIYVD
jgi:hypothetical protein